MENRTTEDVNNMHIIGIAKNENGNKLYIPKNSSDGNDCERYLYLSKDYLLFKTVTVTVNKNAILKAIMTKEGKKLWLREKIY